MSTLPAPHDVFGMFELPISDLVINTSANMRKADDPRIPELAISIRAQGQLTPIHVVWNGTAYEVASGFRRAMAIRDHAAKSGVLTIRAIRILPEDADAVRLIENFVRLNPTTYETSKYFYELATGACSRTRMKVQLIGASVGKSPEYVANLVRFFREMSPEAKSIWEADNDERFTFRALEDLVRLKHRGDVEGERRVLARVLKRRKRSKLSAPALFKTTEQLLAELPQFTTPEESSPKKRERHGMTRREIEELEARLAQIDPNLVEQHEVSARVVYDLFQAMVGKAPRVRATEIVDEIVAVASASEGPRSGDATPATTKNA